MTAYVRKFARNRMAALGGVVLLLLLLAAAFAPLIAPQNVYDLSTLDIMDSRLPPGGESFGGTVYWLGTDDQGRDLLSASLYGLRVSLVVALAGTSAALVIGVFFGILAAYAGGAVDTAIMRVVDLQLAFPSILTALVMVALFGAGLEKVILAIAISQWAIFARTLRSTAIVERTKEYVQAVVTLRYSSARIILVHLLPNSIAPLSVLVVAEIAGAISLEATLSFLGIGLPVTRPSLGLLISNGYSYMLAREYWISMVPGAFLILLLLSINLVGERMRQLNES